MYSILDVMRSKHTVSKVIGAQFFPRKVVTNRRHFMVLFCENKAYAVRELWTNSIYFMALTS
jgi:hypothetical protein